MRIKRIVIHCSDSKFGDVRLFRKWHLQRGWRDIGYHLVILNGNRTLKEFNERDDGLIEAGRPMNLDDDISPDEIGAHAYGFNRSSVGICLVGTDKFTPRQLESLFHAIHFWKRISPEAEVVGHYELDDGKTCPNLNMDLVRAVLGQ